MDTTLARLGHDDRIFHCHSLLKESFFRRAVEEGRL
jgi:hypothetical protein